MKRLFFPLLIFILFICKFSIAENTDSLEIALSNAKEDTVKFYILDELTWDFLYSDIEKAERYGKDALRLASAYDNQKNLGQAHHNLATVFLQQNKNDSALFHFKQAIRIFEEAGMDEKTSGSYNGVGNVYLYQGIFEKALENYLQSLRLLEKGNGKKNKVGLVTANIGIVYYNLNNFDKAIEYYNRALQISIETADSSGMATCCSNLGNVFKDKLEYNKSENYFKKAIAIFENLGETYGLANCYANIGAVKMRNKNYPEAIGYYMRAMDIYKELKSDDGIATVYFDLGGINLEMKKYRKAIDYLNQSIDIAKKIGAKNRIMEGYSVLHEVYFEMNDLKNAYKYMNLFMQVKDTVLNEENSKSIARMQTIYETEKKEQELVAKNAELKKNQSELKQKTIQRNAILFGGIISLALMVVVYFGYREKKKANIAITLQKEEIEQKNKDITDSINYAKRIQTAILPSSQFIRNLFPESFVYYQPRDIVSGDFYFFAEVGNKKIVAACDCTGHGVPGAFMSMIGNDFLHRIVNELQITDTAQMLNELHKNVLQAMNQGENNRTSYDGMDMVVLCYDPGKKEVQYSGAVRPIYYFDVSGFHEVKGDRYSIGGVAASSFEFSSRKISVSHSTSFYLFSDGYADQFGGSDGKKFMAKRFKDLLLSMQNKKMEEQEKGLDEKLQVWKKEREQVDDVLVIGIRI
ncbi:MAG: tetratricopeptide repeat protein [Bacteroidetes bacterium]|nr:tetratricopeptide repeat protein [Bacteroidota bacterium]